MRTVLSLFVVTFLLVSAATAQDSLPNMGIENWTSFGNYEEPSGGVWTTANAIVNLNPLSPAPVTCNKSTDAHSGTYSAKITTEMWVIPILPDILVTGTMATGTFDPLATPPANLVLGTPFTARPLKFTGWYKYFDNAGDSLDIYAVVHKWNSGTQQREIIGQAWLTSADVKNSWTMWDIPFTYFSQDMPDSIHVVFASSANGDQFIGTDGSTLFIDDFALVNTVGIPTFLMPEIGVKAYPNPASQKLAVDLSEMVPDGSIEVYSAEGKLITTYKLNDLNNTLDVSILPEGLFYYVIKEGNNGVNSGSFMMRR